MSGSDAGSDTGGDDASDPADAPVKVEFTPKPSFKVLFDGMQIDMEMGRPYLIQLEVSSGTVKADAMTLMGAACLITMHEKENTEDPDRYFHGIVTRAVSAGLTGGTYRFKLEVRPSVWLLSRHKDCRIYQKLTAFQIVTKVFRDINLSNFEDKRRSGAGDVNLEYCVQYSETSLDFVQRIMELYGFYYFFKFDKTGHTLVFVDDPNGHPKITADMPFRYDQTEYRHVGDHVWEWSNDHDLLPGKFSAQDYNFKTPSADMTAKTVQLPDHEHRDYEHYEYPGLHEDPEIGHRLADIRMQAIDSRRVVVASQSNSRALMTGWRFKLTDHPNQEMNREYLVIGSQITSSGVEGTPNPNSQTLDTYRLKFKCIATDKPFRMERHTQRPMIRGPQTAKVVGAGGDEIMTDEHGRVKVKFHWDRSDTQDDERSCWMRVSQSAAGGAFGSQFIPRVGQEVMVTFLEGNPDRPVVSGVVYNANQTVPHALPANKTRTTMKTNSTPGGGGFNEVRLEDKAGSEEVYIHAQRDFRREVQHDEIATVKNDRNVTITTGDDSLTVSTGDHTITVSGGKSQITAAQSITLSVGANSITIDTGGISINGARVNITGGPVTIFGTPFTHN